MPQSSLSSRKNTSSQLKMFASGQRRNDVYGRMRAIAAKLKDSEIKELSAYYRAGLR